MAFRDRMSRLEKHAEGLYRTLRLLDGTEVRYTDEEVLSALSAAIHQKEHRLLPYIRQMDAKEGMPGLIRALVESHAREQV
jgi:hypothetical protein